MKNLETAMLPAKLTTGGLRFLEGLIGDDLKPDVPLLLRDEMMWQVGHVALVGVLNDEGANSPAFEPQTAS